MNYGEIEISQAEYERLTKLAATEPLAPALNPDVQFLASLVLRLIHAAERQAEYEREQSEYD